MHSKTTAALAIGAATLLAAGGAAAENWVPFYVVPSGVILLDHDSVSRSRQAGHVSARLESTFPTPQRLNRNGRIIDYIKTIDNVDVDCKARVYTNVTRDLFTDSGLQQLSLNEQGDPMMVVPGSVQAALITAFCPKS